MKAAMLQPDRYNSFEVATFSTPEACARADSILLEQIARGSHSAFAALVRTHTRRFYSLSYRYTRNRAEAEDVVQEAFLRLWERPDLWNPERGTRFTTWFCRIIINLCLDRLRKKKASRMPDHFEVVDDFPLADEIMAENQLRHQIEQAINALPERQQTALNLCFYEGFSNQEAAQIMGLRLKALQSLLMRAKTSLKQQMSTMPGSTL